MTTTMTTSTTTSTTTLAAAPTRAVATTEPSHDEASAHRATSTLDGQVRAWLRLEGLVVGLVGAIVYARLGGDWLWFVPAFLLVDLSAIGYLGGPRLGALTYDVAHNWAVGFATLGLGLAAGIPLVGLVGAVLVAHTGLDRTLGYGLKLGTGFKDTHLGRIGR